MTWLFPRHRDEQDFRAADARSRDELLRQPSDPYRGAALGVECAWPLTIEREVTRTLR